MVEPILEAARVRKTYRTGSAEVVARDDLDLTVNAGEFLAVMGPSGSGKTTLPNCLSGLDDIDAGRVRFDGWALHEMSDADRTRQLRRLVVVVERLRTVAWRLARAT